MTSCHGKVFRITDPLLSVVSLTQDDVIKWKHFPRNWPFVRGIYRSPVNSPHKGQWREALMFSLICVWINDWVNNREIGDLGRHRGHYDVTVMQRASKAVLLCFFCCHPEWVAGQTLECLVIEDAVTLLWSHYNVIDMIIMIIMVFTAGFHCNNTIYEWSHINKNTKYPESANRRYSYVEECETV